LGRFEFGLCEDPDQRAMRDEEVKMGLTVLDIEVANPATPEVAERVEFLIDSGAVYSVAPASVLERLGIRPLAQETFRLANGSKIVRQRGGAVFKYEERIGVADVIFGEEGDSNLLGATTLKALGLSLDPLRRELKPLPMILARCSWR
jgi:clan AA aspartic protease